MIENQNPGAGRPALVVALFLALLGGGCGNDDGDKTNLIITGIWVSSDDPSLRGRFDFEGRSVVEYFDATISGKLRFYDPDDQLVTDEPMSGSASKEDIGGNFYWSIELATSDNEISFYSALYDSLVSSALMMGQFTSSRAGAVFKGAWHNLVEGGPASCIVNRAVSISYKVHDLAWNGSGLVAIATPAGGSPGVYEIDTSPASAVFKQVLTSAPPANPAGIAWDPTQGRYWVVSPDKPVEGQFTINSYDSAWEVAGAAVTGNYSFGDSPSFITWGDGKLWYASFFGAPFTPGPYQIDPLTGEVSASDGPAFSRTVGFDLFDGKWWVASMPAGGIWGVLETYSAAGTPTGTTYAPGADGAVAIASEGNGFVWVSSGLHLVRISN